MGSAFFLRDSPEKLVRASRACLGEVIGSPEDSGRYSPKKIGSVWVLFFFGVYPRGEGGYIYL